MKETGPSETEANPVISRNLPSKAAFSALVIGALGVVYGDIGTSVLYAFRECFNPEHGVAPTPPNVLGVLSLIFWALIMVVTVKYLSIVMRADNEGEGGVFALMARALSHEGPKRPMMMDRGAIVMLGLCGTALFAANGIITPSISVLSAVEGLQVAASSLKPFVIPVTLGILVGLFLLQKHGSSLIGSWFGPIMLFWFTAIAVLGVFWIAREPRVLMAISPTYALNFFAENKMHGLVVLSAVVLCVTGCEALYADLGHFGRRPISMAWHWLVFPSVTLNYFGQGALVLNTQPQQIGNPFFELAPPFLLYPLVAIATAATVIASQALISGSFSLAKQAIQLDYLPRMKIIHTSTTAHGQVYIPSINAMLAVACVAMVLGFRDSSSMAAAYGIAVIGTMATTSLLMFVVEYEQWGWKLWQAMVVTGIFLAMDIFFLVGNLIKVWLGGWFTLAVGFGVMIVLTTWKRGSLAMTRIELDRAIPLEDFVPKLASESIHRVKGTAVFITAYPHVTPRVLLHHLKHNKVLHQQVILMATVTENVPTVPLARRVEIQNMGAGFYHVITHYGFMQSRDMREVRQQLIDKGINLEGEISYFMGHMTLRTTGHTRFSLWRKAFFRFMFHNEPSATEFLGIPPNRVVEMGEQTEI